MLYAPRIYLLESLSKTFYVAVCTSTRNFRPRCVSPPLGGEGSGEKKERKIKGAREFVYRPEREKERERIFYFLAPCVNSTACMDVGFFEEENFAILLHNSLYFVISTNYHLFSSIFLEYIIDIKYRINTARGGGERLEGSSTVLEDAFRCSLIRIGGEEKEEGRVVARSRPARRGNNYSDVDRGRVTRALMLADGVCVCVQVGELQRREGSETGETDHEARLPHGYNPELLNDIHAGQR